MGGTLQHGRRTIGTVERRHLLTLDADYADVDFPLDVSTDLHSPFVLHTTWRHTPEAPRYRLVIPLDRGIDAKEYKELAWMVMNRLGGARFDPTTAQAERFMWSPSTQDQSTYFWMSGNTRARYLPVDAWLDGQYGPSDAPAGTGRANHPPATRETVREPLTASAEDQERAVEILAKACDEVEHVYERGEYAGRNEAVFHLMPLLIRFCNAGALDEDMVIDALWTAAQRVEAAEPYERSEFNASIKSARQYAEESGPALPDTTPTKMARSDFEDVDIEVDLWDKTPRLKHIAQAADAIGRNRQAMLAVTIARVLHEVDPIVRLPGTEDGGIGSRAALNLGVALVGSSGQGKSLIASMSRKLLGRGGVDLNPSTGQGLIQAYLRWDPEESKNVVIDDPRQFFYVDEIDTLGALGKDTGSTLLSEMRTMLTGGSTGSANATKERQRSLPAGSYNFQLVAGVQPARAGTLLDGRDAGTPQRFVWVTVTEPKTALHPDDRPPWPGELDWNDAFLLQFELGDPIIQYPKWLLHELGTHDYRISQEGSGGGELSRHGHLNLLRLKLAAGVAFLHESSVIEDLHVEITDMILASSKRVQLECERAVAEALFLKKKAARRSDERASAEVSDEKLAKLAKNARAALLRANGEWVTWHSLRPAHRDRAEFEESVWDALCQMDDVEVDEVQHGQRVRRKAKIADE